MMPTIGFEFPKCRSIRYNRYFICNILLGIILLVILGTVQRIFLPPAYSPRELIAAKQVAEKVCTGIGGHVSDLTPGQVLKLANGALHTGDAAPQIRVWEMECATESGRYQINLNSATHQVICVRRIVTVPEDSRILLNQQTLSNEREKQWLAKAFIRKAGIPVDRLVLLYDHPTSSAEYGASWDFCYNIEGRPTGSRAVRLQISVRTGNLDYLLAPSR